MLTGPGPRRGIATLGLGEQALGEPRTAGQRLLEPLDLQQVDPDGVHSTVTVLARLRGWSTFKPRRRAMWYASSCSGITARIAASIRSVRGIRMISSACRLICSSPSLATAITRAPRTLTSWMLEITFPRTRDSVR